MRHRTHMKLVNLKPPQIAWLLLALSAGIHFLLPSAYRRQFACLSCGIVAVSAGFGLMMWAWSLFRQSGTPIRPSDTATTLVTSGPFRFSRNPMYLGIVVMLLGIAVWVGSVAMLFAPVGFLAFMSLVFIPYEERRLREVFGDDYVSYSRRVRRWI
jgi:protein-S-isoprenylcysteine O-methyltransferase Ste14